jgi:hypothetical protein
MADISKFLDKAHEQSEFAQLADAPVEALAGISAGDAAALKQAFNVKTIRDLATNKYILVAQAIVGLAGAEKK